MEIYLTSSCTSTSSAEVAQFQIQATEMNVAFAVRKVCMETLRQPPRLLSVSPSMVRSANLLATLFVSSLLL